MLFPEGISKSEFKQTTPDSELNGLFQGVQVSVLPIVDQSG
jgi:hypothetical protein